MSTNYNHNLEMEYKFIWASVPTLARTHKYMRDSKPTRCVQQHKS